MYNHIWTVSVVYVCNTTSPRELNYVAPAAFDEALKAGKELIAKKFPNPNKEEWPECPWHPDYELVGIKRGMELDSEEPET